MFAPVEPDTARLICSQDDNTRDAPHCTVTAGSNNLDISLLFQGEIELEDDGMAIDRIEYYARDHCRSAAVYCAYVCSGGLLALLGRWLPHRKLKDFGIPPMGVYLILLGGFVDARACGHAQEDSARSGCDGGGDGQGGRMWVQGPLCIHFHFA